MIRSRMAKALADNKMTQRDLAKKADLTEAAVSKYMSGERAANEISLIKICNALNVSADFLLGIEAELVKHGRWIDQYGDGDWHCSQCGAIVEKDEQIRHYWRRCYHCGAKMDEVEE